MIRQILLYLYNIYTSIMFILSNEPDFYIWCDSGTSQLLRGDKKRISGRKGNKKIQTRLLKKKNTILYFILFNKTEKKNLFLI